MSNDGRQHGEIRWIHLDLPGGVSEQLSFIPGIRLDTAKDMYPTAAIRRMTPVEIEGYRKRKEASYRLSLNEG